MTESSVGILLAFVALFGWGFGDFFIQKTARAVGSYKALFFIGVVALVTLYPFVKDEVALLGADELRLLGVLGFVVIFAALFDFEALRRGKIAVVEPIIGLELPLTVGLGMTLGREVLSLPQMLLILSVFIGIVLAVTEHHTRLHYHKRIFERGVILAGVGAIGMALTNYLVGVSSRGISPLVTIWFAHSLLAVVCGAVIVLRGEFSGLLSDVRRYPVPIIGQSVLDNVAWVAFAFATTAIPLSIATTISEGYIALAVLLGLFVGREKLKRHQLVGVLLATVGVIALSYVSS